MTHPESTGFAVGSELTLTVGPVAHGGHCVARVGDDPHGRVVFVRHALPGEQVRARVTEDAGGAFLRADAIAVEQASPDRVPTPCPHAGPGRCGGCDWQHVTPPAQRRLKATVVCEQFKRLGGIDLDELGLGLDAAAELPGGALHWRTRTAYAADADGQLGLRRHRSHAVERLDGCPLGVAGVGDSPVLTTTWPGVAGVEVAIGSGDEPAVLSHTAAPQRGRNRRAPDRVRLMSGPKWLHHEVLGCAFRVSAGGFWQVHPEAARVFAETMLAALSPRPGERVLDLYAGAGLFTALTAERVGVTGLVLGLEADRAAVADAAHNLRDLPWAQVQRAPIDAAAVAAAGSADLVILDPPRAGAGAGVMRAVLELEPRLVGYLACDPAALARDVRTALDAGWRLAELRVFDAFPMTHHIETFALLAPGH